VKACNGSKSPFTHFIKILSNYALLLLISWADWKWVPLRVHIIFGKEKYRQGQGLKNIGHFQALVFVCHLESRMPRPFLHRCFVLEQKKECRDSINLLLFRMISKRKFLKLNYKRKWRYFSTRVSRYPFFIRFQRYRTAALFMSLYILSSFWKLIVPFRYMSCWSASYPDT
jgi:hypothetical protein